QVQAEQSLLNELAELKALLCTGRFGSGSAESTQWMARLVGHLSSTVVPALCRTEVKHLPPVAAAFPRFPVLLLAHDVLNHVIALRSGSLEFLTAPLLSPLLSAPLSARTGGEDRVSSSSHHRPTPLSTSAASSSVSSASLPSAAHVDDQEDVIML